MLQFGETSEHLPDSNYVTKTPGAEARFSGGAEGYLSRFGPKRDVFETRMALLEGAEAARATATGMAAVTSALMCCLKAGDRVVAGRAMFGASRLRLATRHFFDADKRAPPTPGAPRCAIIRRALFCEKLASDPSLELVDLPGVAAIAIAVEFQPQLERGRLA